VRDTAGGGDERRPPASLTIRGPRAVRTKGCVCSDFRRPRRRLLKKTETTGSLIATIQPCVRRRRPATDLPDSLLVSAI
jgi:hypothetical protein